MYSTDASNRSTGVHQSRYHAGQAQSPPEVESYKAGDLTTEYTGRYSVAKYSSHHVPDLGLGILTLQGLSSVGSRLLLNTKLRRSGVGYHAIYHSAPTIRMDNFVNCHVQDNTNLSQRGRKGAVHFHLTWCQDKPPGAGCNCVSANGMWLCPKRHPPSTVRLKGGYSILASPQRYSSIPTLHHMASPKGTPHSTLHGQSD
jgi:hypothetical protein